MITRVVSFRKHSPRTAFASSRARLNGADHRHRTSVIKAKAVP